MSNKQKVCIEFINKKGVLKKGSFYMDKKTYEILFDESINEEFRKQYLIDEYHEYEREKYYKRKYKKVDIEILDLINSNNIENYEINKRESYNRINELLEELNIDQRNIIYLLLYKGYTQNEIAKKLGISKQAVSKRIKVISNKARKIFKKGWLYKFLTPYI